MEDRRLAQRVFLALVVLAIIQQFYYFPQLPEKVAIHFNFRGLPDNWARRETFAAIFWSVLGLNTLIFLGISRLLPRFPGALVNIPNRDYWLSGERRSQTIPVLQGYVWWINNLTFALLLIVFQMSIRVNLREKETVAAAPFWVPVAIYILALGYLVFRMYRRFRLPPRDF